MRNYADASMTRFYIRKPIQKGFDLPGMVANG